MSKNRITHLMATALAAATIGLFPAAAHAETAPTAGTAVAAGTTTAAADGYLYAWEHSWKGGRQATWADYSDNWADRNMRNQASSVHNNGFAGAYEDVRLFWHTDQSGAWYCLGNGSYLMDMRYDRFPYNGNGGGEPLNDNISSHDWVNAC
ncbi:MULTISPECIES: hypothetical protein [unclassified Streptomyces]|uniref:hypothetical protein n=1 Tax=unclassified Streptomyces TaxID=2593676 RepID=UPI0035D66142